MIYKKKKDMCINDSYFKIKKCNIVLKPALKVMKNNLHVTYSMSSIYCNNFLPYILEGGKSHEKINNDFRRHINYI